MTTSRRLRTLGALGLALAILPACRRAQTPAEAPEGGAPAGKGDAAALPGFDVSGSAEGGGRRGVPYERFQVAVGDAPVRGPVDAPVTIVAFYDFECPYCEKGHRTLQEIERLYEGKVRVAYKAFPLDFHSQALGTALLVRSAHAQGKFWALHDHLFDQGKIDLTRQSSYARAVGLDPGVLARDLETLRFASSVVGDMRQGHRLGVRGTPAYFINGRPVSGARPVRELAAIIDEELGLAERWRAEGVAGADLYAHATADGYKAVQYTQKKGLRPDLLYPIPVGTSPQRGDPLAPVTIIVFTDFECPYCARGNESVEAVRRRFGAKVRLVFKHLPLPFHSHAFPAARAALAAGEQGKFWEFHDRLFASQDELDEESLVAIARDLRLDLKRFKERMSSSAFDAEIASDLDLARTIGIRGTPAYFVNGRAIGGAVGELEFSIIVQAELERAEARIARGAPREGLYEALASSEE